MYRYIVLSLVILLGASASAQGSLPSEDALNTTLEKIQIQGSELGSAVTMQLEKSVLQQGLELLPPEDIQKALDGYVQGIVFIYHNPKQIMVLMEFKQEENAGDFLGYEEKVLREKDVAYKEFIVESDYKSYPTEKVFISRKTVESMGQKQRVTVIVGISAKYVLEANFLEGEYTDDELKQYGTAIWEVVK